ALAFGTPVSAGVRRRVCGIDMRNRLAVDLHIADRRMDSVEMHDIAARGHGPVASVAAFRPDVEPDRVSALLEAQPGALELAVLIVVAAAVVLVELELAVLLVLGGVVRAETVNVDRQRIDLLLSGILHRRPERNHRARPNIDGQPVERNGFALDFAPSGFRLLLVEEVVPEAVRQIDLTVTAVVEQRRNQEIIADEELIVDLVG